jgi:spore germination cell wall hydrolase CwlJ-like protein
MRITLAVTAALTLAIFAGHARGGQESAIPPASAEAAIETLEWPAYVRALSGRAPARSMALAAEGDKAASPDVDVVDAHWMALTMWGEARGQGEEAMRAVGHVIDNRRRASGADPDFVTDTVSEAFQFSCWNPGDPNREAMLNVDALPPEGHDHLMWLAARRIADEILAGRSQDPTGGGLFYHSDAVAPSWSQGLSPVFRIGRHLFFRAARRA